MHRFALSFAALPVLSILTRGVTGQEWVPPDASAAAAQQDKQDKKEPENLQTVRLTARIVNTEGQPIAGAGIAGFKSKELKNSHLCRTNPTATSDADGKITLTVKRAAADRRSWLLAAKKYASRVLRVNPTESEENGVEIYRADLGDVVMHEGFSILGLVRDQDGKPIVGAEVTASEILGQLFVNRNSGTTHATTSYGVSDDQGRVRLSGIPRHGASVKIKAKGHYNWSLDYLNRHTPLVATLDKGGQVTGVILDFKGDPVSNARVIAYSESSASSSSAVVVEGGRFQLDLPGKGRYRLRYYGKLDDSNNYTYEYTKIFDEPQKDMKLQFGQGAMDNRGNPIEKGARDAAAIAEKLAGSKKAKDKDKDKVKLRIIDAKTGIALREARAAVLWLPPTNWQHSPGYLERQLERKKEEKLDERGNLKLTGPRQNQPNTGRVIVTAKGYAPLIIKDVEWDDEGKNKLEAKMFKESVVSGSVIDPDTGKPLAGVRVVAVTNPAMIRNYQPQPVRRKLEGNQGSVTTDAKGEFRLGELPAGDLQIYLAHPKRADIPPVSVSVKAATAHEGVRIEYPKGGSLIGKITGTEVKSGWQVRVRRMSDPQNNMGMTYGLSANQQYESVDVTTDGQFEVHGLTRANYFLSLVMPYPHGVLEIPMEPIRMRRKDMKRTFDIADDLPGRLTGTVKIEGGGFTPGRLMLVARSAKSYNMYSGYYGRFVLQGEHALLDARGGFDLPLGEDQYYLQVIDLMTKVTLYQGTSPIAITATKTTKREVVVPVAPVTVELKPEQEGDSIRISMIEIRPEHAQPPAARNFNVFGGQVDPFTGVGLRITPGQTTIQLILPCVPCKILARSDAHNLDPKMGLHNFPAQGEVELTPEAGKTNRVEIEVSRPQIDDGEEEKAKEKKVEQKAVLEAIRARR